MIPSDMFRSTKLGAYVLFVLGSVSQWTIGILTPFSTNFHSPAQSLDLSGNRLSGTIPSFVGWLTSLGELATTMCLYGCYLSRMLAQYLSTLFSGELILANNTLSGTIPSETAWARSLGKAVACLFPFYGVKVMCTRSHPVNACCC